MAEQIPTFKLVLVGDGGTGKVSLFPSVLLLLLLLLSCCSALFTGMGLPHLRLTPPLRYDPFATMLDERLTLDRYM